MKKKISMVIVVLIIVAGLGFLLYPTISDYLKTLSYHRAIANFKTTVAQIDEETYEDIMSAAQDYNKKVLARGNVRTKLSARELEEYESQLKIDDSGIMGYVVIPKINVSLPIYHGTSDAVLQSGIGHLEGSSLPIGGEGCHSVLSGHRGLPSAKLFTNIDQLKEGDTFTVRILRETLTYEVDEIKTVLPYEVDKLPIVKGEDYCTLLTCTPYGINTHRLLVRGHRIETPEEDLPYIENEQAVILDPYDPAALFAVFAFIFTLAVVTIVLIIRIRTKRKRRKIMKQIKEEQEKREENPPEQETPPENPSE